MDDTSEPALRADSADWFVTPPQWEEVRERPAFDGRAVSLRGVKGGKTTALLRVLRRPWLAARLIGAGVRARSLGAFMVWISSAPALGLRSVAVRRSGHAAGSTVALPRASRRRQSPPAVTLAVIAQDEAARIEKMLAAAAPFVEAVLVVDGGSTDATVQIARAAGATVFQRDYTTELEQRNFLQDRVQTPWTLQLDCDEVIEPDLGMLMRRMLTHAGFDCIFLPFLNVLDEDDAPFAFPLVIPRLFESRFRFQGRFHSRIAGYRRPLYLPANGPFVVHRKTRLQHYRNQLRYAEVSPEWSSLGADELAELQSEVTRLEGHERGDRRLQT